MKNFIISLLIVVLYIQCGFSKEASKEEKLIMIGNLLQMEECTKVQDRHQDPVHSLLVDLPLNPQIDLLHQVEIRQRGHHIRAQDLQTTTAGLQHILMPLQLEVWGKEENNN